MFRSGHLPFSPLQSTESQSRAYLDEHPLPLFDAGVEPPSEVTLSQTVPSFINGILPLHLPLPDGTLEAGTRFLNWYKPKDALRQLQCAPGPVEEMSTTLVNAQSPLTNCCDQLCLTVDVLAAIRASVGSHSPETGGMLGGSREDYVVRHFHFDSTAQRNRATYSPDHMMLNRLLSQEWNPNGINFLGFIHSHPGGPPHPSRGDEIYAARILGAIPDLRYLLLPIVILEAQGGGFKIHPFAALRDDKAPDSVRICPLQLSILPNVASIPSLPLTQSAPQVSDETLSLPQPMLTNSAPVALSLLFVVLATLWLLQNNQEGKGESL